MPKSSFMSLSAEFADKDVEDVIKAYKKVIPAIL
jgi:hypothetical protein